MDTIVPPPGLQQAPASPPPVREAGSAGAGGFAIEVPAALLARARRGEPAALEQLYRRFERPVFTLVLRICGNREEASDVLQDAMLKMIDRIGGLRGDSPFSGIGAAHADPAPQASPAPRAQEDADFARARADLARAAARMAEVARKRAGSGALENAYAAAAARPVLGVLFTADDGPGAYVTGVTPGSAAAEAGLRSGDRLLSINGSRILGSTGELRVGNARTLVGALEAGKPATIGYQRGDSEHSVEVTPTMRSRLMAFDRAELAELLDDTRLAALRDGSLQAITESVRIDGDGIKREITRALDAAGLRNCPGEGCRAPVLMSALRWSGLNLASVDEKLGRYFGTDRGVLVLSSGGLEGLEPGDVILEIDGTAVADPRDVMAALRDQPADARVTIAYLRDRSRASTRVAVPRLRSLDLPAPPAPPAPPASPEPPTPAPAPPRPPRPA